MVVSSLRQHRKSAVEQISCEGVGEIRVASSLAQAKEVIRTYSPDYLIIIPHSRREYYDHELLEALFFVFSELPGSCNVVLAVNDFQASSEVLAHINDNVGRIHNVDGRKFIIVSTSIFVSDGGIDWPSALDFFV